MINLQTFNKLLKGRPLLLISIFAIVVVVSSTYYVASVQNETESMSTTETKRKLSTFTELIYVLGYPYTGTGVTLKIMEQLTGKSMATNVGSIPVDTSIFAQGPYWTSADLPRDSDKVLVESQCSAYCLDCPSRMSYGDMNNYPSWAQGCRTATYLNPSTGNAHLMPPYTLDQRLGSAVVTVRNPLSTVVSRFIASVSENPHYKDNGLVNREGLIQWCEQITNEAFTYDSFKRVVAEFHVGHLRPNVPCYSEFIRIAAWYNNANKFVTGMDHHRVYFEGFTKDLDLEVNKLADFTGIEVANTDITYTRTAPKYSWFTDDEVANIRMVMYKVASRDTWFMFQRYFSAFVPPEEV